VALIGPRQVGKTTRLSRQLSGGERPRQWQQDFIRAYLERDIPLLGRRIPAETLRRF
jgi:predicted AAA+ superfamily ATPase